MQLQEEKQKQPPFEIQIFSDLHLEIDGCVTEKYVWPKIQRKCDYLALLGDIGNPFSEAYESFLADLSPKFKKIILIAGNTDYYNQDESSVQYTMQEVEVQISKLCKKYGNIDFLQRKCLRIDEVRYMIIGCTLWSRVQSEYVIKNWEDYKYIKVMDKNLNRIRDLTAKDTNQFHDDDLRFINQYIEEAQKIQYNLIVLTHFAPIKRNTLQENYRCTLQQTQASDLEFLMKQSQIIKLWACKVQGKEGLGQNLLFRFTKQTPKNSKKKLQKICSCRFFIAFYADSHIFLPST